jgi:hypothetical protein
MINIQSTPNDPRVETIQTHAPTIGERAIAPSRIFARTTLATVLIGAAIAALAITSLAQSNERAAAQSRVLIQPASVRTVPLSVPSDFGDVGPFAFGHVEIDWNPSAPGGVPGFDSSPPGSRR